MSGRVNGERRAYSTTLRREQAHLTRERILEAARVLFVSRGYPAVTMQEIAAEAAVAYQTVYAQFGNKVRLAIELCDSELVHVGATVQMVASLRGEADAAARAQMLAAFARRLYEPCAEILRFMRESGDAELLGRYREIGGRRLELLTQLGPWSGEHTLDAVWALTGPELYESFVLDRSWSPEDFEAWLSSKLRTLVLA